MTSGPNTSGPNYGRVAFYAASAGIIAWSALVVPLPFVEYLPGEPESIPPLLEIDGTETTDLDGETALLTVFLRQQPTVPAVLAALDDDRSLIPLEELYPQGRDREERFEVQRDRFDRQFDIAAAVGAQAAGVDVELVTEVVVAGVLPGSPADGLLAPGDAVLAVNGEPVIAAEELQAVAREATAGDVLTLTVRHQGQVREVDVELAAVEGSDQGRIGVAIDTAVVELRLPFEVELSEVEIGGPSAGMMIALTVYDLLSDDDLLRGRTVLGTGTVDADGRVGPVGGVAAKMQAAAEYGADLVLVPSWQIEEAARAAPEGLDVVGVETLQEAIATLSGAEGVTGSDRR